MMMTKMIMMMRRTIKINLYTNKGVHNKTMITKMMMMILILKIKLSAKKRYWQKWWSQRLKLSCLKANNDKENDDDDDYED